MSPLYPYSNQGPVQGTDHYGEDLTSFLTPHCTVSLGQHNHHPPLDQVNQSILEYGSIADQVTIDTPP